MEITENAITFDCIEWAKDILASVRVVKLSVTFSLSTTHASDEIVYPFLRFILTTWFYSIRVLKLLHLENRYFRWMQSQVKQIPQNTGQLLPSLQSVSLKYIPVIDSEILTIFSHTTVLHIISPVNMDFAPEKVTNMPNIHMRNLKFLVLRFEKPTTVIKTQVLPIDLPKIESIQIHHDHLSDNYAISIRPLASMSTLTELIVNGYKEAYLLSELRDSLFMNNLMKLTVPIEDSIDLHFSKLREVKKVICRAPRLTEATFLLQHLRADKQQDFATHIDNIICKKRNAQYRVEFINNTLGKFMQYKVHKIN